MSSGIAAKDNVNGRIFYFYTESQEDVENSMALMGYGSRHYSLSLFKDRLQPMDDERYSDV